MDEYIMGYLYSEIGQNDEKNELLLHREAKEAGCRRVLICMAVFNKVLEHAKLIHGETSQSSGGDGSPRDGVQRKAFGLLTILYLDHFTQDDSYICKSLLSSMFKISAPSVLGISEVKRD